MHFDHSYLVGPRPCRASAKKSTADRQRRVVAKNREAFHTRDLYITRPNAVVGLILEHLPADRNERIDFWEARCAAIRRDGRVQERLIVSLPIEFAGDLAVQAAQAVMRHIGQGRVPYIAAIHRGNLAAVSQRTGGGQENLHLHADWADADISTGRVVFGASDRGSTRRLRAAVAEALNQFAEDHTIAVRIDPRRLAIQHAEALREADMATAIELDRLPGIKMGPALYVAKRGELRNDQARRRLDEATRRAQAKRVAEEQAVALRRSIAITPPSASADQLPLIAEVDGGNRFAEDHPNPVRAEPEALLIPRADGVRRSQAATRAALDHPPSMRAEPASDAAEPQDDQDPQLAVATPGAPEKLFPQDQANPVCVEPGPLRISRAELVRRSEAATRAAQDYSPSMTIRPASYVARPQSDRAPRRLDEATRRAQANRVAEDRAIPVRVDPQPSRIQRPEAVREGDMASTTAMDHSRGLGVGRAPDVAEPQSDQDPQLAVAKPKASERFLAEDQAEAIRRSIAATALAASADQLPLIAGAEAFAQAWRPMAPLPRPNHLRPHPGRQQAWMAMVTAPPRIPSAPAPSAPVPSASAQATPKPVPSITNPRILQRFSRER